MRIVNPKLLKTYHESGHCEICGKWCLRRDPHHIIPRGMGSANRVDHPLNLLSLGSAYDCDCHRIAQSNTHLQIVCFSISGAKKGMSAQEAMDEVQRIIALPKGATI